MSRYIQPDQDRIVSSNQFDLPEGNASKADVMHAAAIVIDRFGILLRGASGSGKSHLQRAIRRQAQQMGLFSALISDDYVALLPGTETTSLASSHAGQAGEGRGPLIAFGPKTTHALEEVRGLGLISLEEKDLLPRAVVHLLVDLVDEKDIARMPTDEDLETQCAGASIASLRVPNRSVDVAVDLILARLSTWKHS